MAKGKKKRSSTGSMIIAVILIVAGLAAFKVFGPNTGAHTRGEYLYVHTGSGYNDLKDSLRQGGFVSDMFTFNLLAKSLGLTARVHAGKYKIPRYTSSYRIIRLLRSGRQTPVKLTINKLRTKKDLVRLLAANLEPDTAIVRQLLYDHAYLSQFGLDTNTLMGAVMPDTYDFFWNTTADKAFRKIEKNYDRFWDEAHKSQARDHGLTPMQAITVASIVDDETNLADDKPNIASVYLNRIKAGMKLQADPTVKFAVGDFTIRRIAGAMLESSSPYNTYKYAGLPPGPICTPSSGSLMAVLNAPKTNYLYFCATEDFSGRSAFAATYDEQLKNAARYRKALDARGIH